MTALKQELIQVENFYNVGVFPRYQYSVVFALVGRNVCQIREPIFGAWIQFKGDNAQRNAIEHCRKYESGKIFLPKGDFEILNKEYKYIKTVPVMPEQSVPNDPRTRQGYFTGFTPVSPRMGAEWGTHRFLNGCERSVRNVMIVESLIDEDFPLQVGEGVYGGELGLLANLLSDGGNISSLPIKWQEQILGEIIRRCDEEDRRIADLKGKIAHLEAVVSKLKSTDFSQYKTFEDMLSSNPWMELSAPTRADCHGQYWGETKYAFMHRSPCEWIEKAHTIVQLCEREVKRQKESLESLAMYK